MATTRTTFSNRLAQPITETFGLSRAVELTVALVIGRRS